MIRSIILTVCLIITTVCLGAGYILAGYWLILPVFLAMLLFWIFTKNQPVFITASSLLVVFVILAVIGITADLSLILMIVACIAALVSWDLMQFKYSLGLAAFAGLTLALISSYINMQFPFVLILLLVLTTVGGLIYGMQYILKKKH